MGKERGVSVVMLNSFGFDLLGTSLFGPSPLLWASLCFVSPFSVAEERASFLVQLEVLPLSTSSTLTEQRNSKDVSFGQPGRVWQDVSMSFAPGQGPIVCVGQSFLDDRGKQSFRLFLGLLWGWGLSDRKSDCILFQP